MAAKKKLAKLKTQMDDVRSIAIETVISANKIVYEGIQRLAEHELDELQKSYKSVVDGLKASTKKGDVKSTAQAQLDLNLLSELHEELHWECQPLEVGLEFTPRLLPPSLHLCG